MDSKAVEAQVASHRKRVFAELATTVALLGMLVIISLGALFDQASRSSRDEVMLMIFLNGALVLVYLVLVAFQVGAAKLRLKRIRIRGKDLVAYGEMIPISEIRLTHVGRGVVWMDLAPDQHRPNRRRILWRSDFEDLEGTFEALRTAGVEVREHRHHVPPAFLS